MHCFPWHRSAAFRSSQCQPGADGRIPDHATRRKIEKQVTKSGYEHLIIFVDEAKTTQIWQWVARQPGQPARYREHHYYPGHQSGDALIQKLSQIYIPLNEEEALDLTGATHRLRDAFDRDRVTKKFYDRFKAEHTAFLAFIKGITDQADKEWYASLMLNRLMFIYFIQRKGFLDGEVNYLRDRLRKVQLQHGRGKFLTFYRYFLIVLFHEGFDKAPRERVLDADLTALLGAVPYLNGGLFDVHELEERNPKLDIPDEAFERLFAFFDEWDWHLDSRPLRNDSEINPDVLGYIFEKYINQKQMGAYYTKEDITEYIGKSTIIPFLFDAAQEGAPGGVRARLAAVAALARRPRPLHLPIRPPRRRWPRRRSDPSSNRRLPRESPRSQSAAPGTGRHRMPTDCPPKPGGSTSPVANAVWRFARSSDGARSTRSTI